MNPLNFDVAEVIKQFYAAFYMFSKRLVRCSHIWCQLLEIYMRKRFPKCFIVSSCPVTFCTGWMLYLSSQMNIWYLCSFCICTRIFLSRFPSTLTSPSIKHVQSIPLKSLSLLSPVSIQTRNGAHIANHLPTGAYWTPQNPRLSGGDDWNLG